MILSKLSYETLKKIAVDKYLKSLQALHFFHCSPYVKKLFFFKEINLALHNKNLKTF